MQQSCKRRFYTFHRDDLGKCRCCSTIQGLSCALRLTNTSNKTSYVIILDDTSIKGWLPGKIEISKSIKLPNNIKAGSYGLAIGILDKASNEPVVRLAIEGRDDGWYPISDVEVIK